ncbi:MAG TPA: flagellar biosynthetic protein FliO [Dongiaceae bacterium]|jgi:flagellar protein FliO/FliZ|nr:flagellar biosynthetic protein FliO [Dongiaceae bacterium]
MGFDTYLRFILVLVFVLGLVLALGWVLRRSGIGGHAMVGKGRRLGVVETAFLGPKHRLVLVRRDAVEHLVLIGPSYASVVESGIAGQPPQESFRALVGREAAAPSPPDGTGA